MAAPQVDGDCVDHSANGRPARGVPDGHGAPGREPRSRCSERWVPHNVDIKRTFYAHASLRLRAVLRLRSSSSFPMTLSSGGPLM